MIGQMGYTNFTVNFTYTLYDRVHYHNIYLIIKVIYIYCNQNSCNACSNVNTTYFTDHHHHLKEY